MYRVAELAQGWTGSLIKKQWLFVGFEGVMVIVACLALNLFNPAFAFPEDVMGLGGLGSKRKSRKQHGEKSASGVSGSNSDVDGVVRPNV